MLLLSSEYADDRSDIQTLLGQPIFLRGSRNWPTQLLFLAVVAFQDGLDHQNADFKRLNGNYHQERKPAVNVGGYRISAKRRKMFLVPPQKNNSVAAAKCFVPTCWKNLGYFCSNSLMSNILLRIESAWLSLYIVNIQRPHWPQELLGGYR